MACLSTVAGYGGSGFRSKEVVSDVMDNLLPAGFFDEESVAYEAISAEWFSTSVLGVGPCRTVNYLFGYPFFQYEKLDPDSKGPLYLELLEYTANYVRQRYDEFREWPNMAIYYILHAVRVQQAASGPLLECWHAVCQD